MIELAVEIVKQIINLSGVVLASGLITSIFTEFLKIGVLGMPAKKYPKATAAVVAFVVSAIAVFSLNLVPLDTWASWIIAGGSSLLTAIKSYDWILKGLYAELKKDA